MKEYTGEERRRDSVKRSILSKYGSELICCSTGTGEQSRSVIFSSEISLHKIINDAFQRSHRHSQSTDRTDAEPNIVLTKQDWLKEAAHILQKDIKESSQTITKVSQVSMDMAMAVVPDSLVLFLEHVTSLEDNEDTSANPCKILSVA